MQVYVDTMLNLIDKLAALGETLNDNFVFAKQLVSIHDSYSTLVTALESRSESDLSLDFVKDKLIGKYQKRRNSNTGNSSQETAMKVLNEEYNSGRQNECYLCQKFAHQKKDCRKYQFWKAKKEKKNKASGSNNKLMLKEL